jgi:hypothetical protein
MMALSGDGEPMEAGAVWLESVQHADGGWGLSADDPESGWQTAWGVLALARAGRPTPAKRGASWLLTVSNLHPVDDDMQLSTNFLGFDPTLRGWPWLPGQAMFVEPTALAMLALLSAPGADGGADRVTEGAAMLVDRRCPGGGWNVGNPLMLGAAMPARAHTTALAVLALARAARDALLPEDTAALRVCMHWDGSPSALALGLLALRELEEDDPAAAASLAALQLPDGSWNGSAYDTALAILADGGLP